jgi:hypothetical protein
MILFRCLEGPSKERVCVCVCGYYVYGANITQELLPFFGYPEIICVQKQYFIIIYCSDVV